MTSLDRQRPSVRDQNRRHTSNRIVTAAADLTREHGDVVFTMPQVAKRSGVSLRTLYRYFPKRQDLVDALASVADQADVMPLPESLEDLEPWLVTAWTNLLQEEALLRAQHQGQGGVAVRKTRTEFARGATANVIRSLRPDLSAARVEDLVDTALLVTSSTALFEFIDVIDIDVERGARLAAQAMLALLQQP